MSLEDEEARIEVDDGEVFDPREIRPAIRRVGFDAGEIELTVSGRLLDDEERLLLRLSGPVERLPIATGSETRGLFDQIGTGVRIRGRFDETGEKPFLEVVSWSRLSDESP